MASLIGLLLLIGIGALVVRSITALTSSEKSPPRTSPTGSGPATNGALPYSKRKYLFSAAERSFYEVLTRLTPDHTVFAKVRLADLVYVNRDTAERQSFLNRINQKHVDFVLCDETLAPVLAIELDDSSHDNASRRERDEFVDGVLTAAALPVLHIRAKHGYVVEEVRAMLSPHTGQDSPERFGSKETAVCVGPS